MRSDLKPILLPVAEYSPDMPEYNNPGSNNLLNCIPRTPNSYGPFPSLASFGGALPNTCLGAIAAEDSGGNNYVFSGDSTDLFEYASSSATNVSKTAGGYAVSTGERWRFVQFGQRIIATDFDDAMQSFVLGSSTKFADLANGAITSLTLVAGSGYSNGTYALTVSNAGSGTGFTGTVTVSGGTLSSYAITNGGKLYPQTATIAVPAGAGAGTLGSITPTISTIAPQARYAAVIDNFLVTCNTFDSTNGNQPQRVWWSALNDPTYWPTPGTNLAAQFQSSFNDLYGDGGWCMGVVGQLGNADGAIFQERAVWRVNYSGPPGTFSFTPAEGVRGTPAPNSLIHFGNFVYYLGQDGFYKFDGSSSQPIGANKVDKTFYAMVDQNNMHRIDGCVDPLNKLVYWAFPSVSNINGNPDYIIAYNWNLDRWSLINISCETIFYSMSFGYTLDTMPGGTLDQIIPSLDSRVWTGGSLILTGFDTNHTLSYFNGPNLAPVLDTSEIEPYPGTITFVQNTRPLVDGGTPSVALAARNILNSTEPFGTAIPINSFGTAPQTINGRYVKAEVTLPAGSTWQHFQGVELEAIPNGVQ